MAESYSEQLFLLIAEDQTKNATTAQTVPESYLEQLFQLIAETQVCHDRFASFPRMPS